MEIENTTPKRSAHPQGWLLVSWWVRITSPSSSSPASKRSPQWREKIISLLIPISILLTFLEMLTVLGDPAQLTILGLGICFNVGALFLKRSGMTRIVGIVIVLTLELSLFSAFLAAGGSHPGIEHVPLLDYLLQAVIVAMTLFTPILGVLIALLNCITIVMLLKFYPFDGDLRQHLAESFWGVALPPIFVQIFVTAVFFIVIHILLDTIRRADKAEELAELRESELKLQEQERERSQQLEVGTRTILQTLNRTIASGDFSERVPLSQENILWRIGYSINYLLARLQGLRQEKADLVKARAVANQLKECMSQGQVFPLSQWTGTFIDPLIIEHNKRCNMPAKLSDQPPLTSKPF